MAIQERSPGIRPSSTLGRRLDIAARSVFPAGSTLLLMLLADTPLGIPGQAVVLPAISLICIWFWSVNRPAAMPPPVVFLLGVLLDLLAYNPLGVGVLTLLIAHGIALRVKEFLARHRFAAGWLAFCLMETGAAALGWALAALLSVRLLSIGPAIFQAVLAAALYPVLAIPMARAHRSLAAPEQA